MKTSTSHTLILSKRELAAKLGYSNTDAVALVQKCDGDDVVIEIKYSGLPGDQPDDGRRNSG